MKKNIRKTTLVLALILAVLLLLPESVQAHFVQRTPSPPVTMTVTRTPSPPATMTVTRTPSPPATIEIWTEPPTRTPSPPATSGTTGTDGRTTISAHATDGRIYIENRAGFNMTYRYQIFTD